MFKKEVIRRVIIRVPIVYHCFRYSRNRWRILKHYIGIVVDQFLFKFIYRDISEDFCGEKKYFGKEEFISGEYLKYRCHGNVTIDWIIIYEKGVIIPSPFYYLLKKSELVGKNAIVISHDNKIILESTIFQYHYFHVSRNIKDILFRHKRKFEKEIEYAISLINCLDGNYFHWVADSLLRLLCIDELGGKLPEIIIRKNSPGFIKESLVSLFNIPEEKIVYYDNNRVLVNLLLVPSFRFIKEQKYNFNEIYSQTAIKTLKSISLKTVKRLPLKKNYLIIRKDAIQRRLINYKELLIAISEYNFEPLILENMLFNEQRTAFFNAEIIIGLHGAAFVNLIFADDPLVIELFPEERNIFDAQLFYNISRALDYKHNLIIVKSSENQDVKLDDITIVKIKDIIHEYFKGKG